MVQYVVKIAQRILTNCQHKREGMQTLRLLGALAEELDRLDPRDFLPDAQFDFILARVNARSWGATTSFQMGSDSRFVIEMTTQVLDILSRYGGDGSHVVTRSFAFIKDDDLRQIIERDYRELILNVFPSGAWKCTVVLAGSILEAILFDQLTASSSIEDRARASTKAPKKSGVVRDLAAGDWKLIDLIDVAADINLIPEQRARSFDQVLRDYRNFIHPKKEVRSEHSCTEAEAMMARGALDGVCNILT